MTGRLAWIPFAAFLAILPFPGTVAIRLLLLVIVFVIAGSWARGRFTEIRSLLPSKLPLALWGLVACASLSYAVDPAYSLGEIKNELGYTALAFFAFFVLGRRPDTARLAIGFGSGVSLIIITAWGTFTWVGNGRHWLESGAHGGSATIATYVVSIAPVLLLLFFTTQSTLQRRLVAMAGLTLLWLAAITGQRAVWPTLGAEGVALAALARHLGVRVGRAGTLAAVFAVCVLALAGLLLANQHRMGGEDLNLDTRLRFWPQVIDTIVAHPLVGSGFGIHSLKKAYPELIPSFNTQLWHAHNVFLNYGVWLGLPGILALAGVFLSLGRWFAQRISAHPAAVAGVCLIVGVVARNQFNDFFMRDMSLLFWALVGLFAGLCTVRRTNN